MAQNRPKPYTVCGVDGTTNQRYIGYVIASNVNDAEEQAYWQNDDLLIAAVFEGHIASVDFRAGALPEYDKTKSKKNVKQPA